MRPYCLRLFARLFVALAVFSLSGLAAEARADPAQINLRPIPAIKLAAPAPLSPAEAAHIRQLIWALATIDKPDVGLSATLSGSAFAPLPTARSGGAMLLTAHGLQTSSEFAELVALGPKSLPLLLAALDDQTPTKLTIDHDPMRGGGMWFAHELRGNPANLAEQKVLRQMPVGSSDSPRDTRRSYTVKIGDVCFAIVGQIVGRSYLAVRYQPTSCVILNSPTHDATLAREVREIWSSDNPARHLLDSLLLDYASEGVFNGRSLDGWDVGSALQCGAATRLLYYFPHEAAPFIAARLRTLDVQGFGPGSTRRSAEEMQVLMKREVANGVCAADLVKAVAWSEEPSIRGALNAIFATTTNTEIFRFSLPAAFASQPHAVRERLEEFLSKLPEIEDGPFGDGYHLLRELGSRFGPEARPAFERYVSHASAQRIRTMSHALRTTRGEWSVALLGGALDDRRPADGWSYPLNPGQNEPRRPIRLCDEAAETIAANFPALVFKLAGEPELLDRQIATMRDRITRNEF